jgi:miniconductance mechanosensitive channel
MDTIKNILSQYMGIDPTHWVIPLFEFSAYSFAILFIYYIFKVYILSKIRNTIKSSTNNFGNYLIKHNLFTRLIALIPIGLISFVSGKFTNTYISSIGDVVTTLLMCFFVVGFIFSFLNAFVDIASNKGFKKLPLKPISQMLKIIITLLAIVISYSKLIGESPSTVLAGIGALSAVLLLIFKDTLQGLVAAFQITFFDTVRKGDWITVNSLGVDGDVLDINLNVITIKCFDNTTTTIPTHSLMNHSYKNYRDMFTRGRRIKRSINIDVHSCKRITEEKLEELIEIPILKDYINKRYSELNGLELTAFNSTRYMTNLGTFRKYIHYYLSNHPEISHNNTLLVRQLDDKGLGLPIEIYCFTEKTGWVINEEIKADIFDHLYTVVELFDLKVFQQPTGDFSTLKNT